MPAISSIDVDERGVLMRCPTCGRRNRMAYGRLCEVFRCSECHTTLPAVDESIEIRDAAIFASMTGRSALPVLVDFWASWCGPCKMMAPEIDRIAAEGAGHWLVAKLDTEELSGLASQFGISAIPTLILFENGREVARKAGAMRAPEIRRWIEQSRAPGAVG